MSEFKKRSYVQSEILKPILDNKTKFLCELF